ncbi:F0F1 ATP synthase subunit B [Paenibacillus sp. TRM 82003]|nr:F0F1 ATP synthase subunit B [Paenibacillus sp. TRM 82003]MCI3923469.1 F0F1 ATP synthase subunit B [Paenibacillus sp. TRM 82003]
MVILWENILITVVSFAILYWLLSRYAFKPLFSIMEKRREIVMGELEQAEKDRKEAAALLAEQRKAIETARAEAKEIIENSRTMSTKSADDIVQAAKNEATRLKEAAVQDIVSEKNSAIAELRTQVGQMSVQIASKIIEKEVDSKSQEALVDKYLKEVGSR